MQFLRRQGTAQIEPLVHTKPARSIGQGASARCRGMHWQSPVPSAIGTDRLDRGKRGRSWHGCGHVHGSFGGAPTTVIFDARSQSAGRLHSIARSLTMAVSLHLLYSRIVRQQPLNNEPDIERIGRSKLCVYFAVPLLICLPGRPCATAVRASCVSARRRNFAGKFGGNSGEEVLSCKGSRMHSSEPTGLGWARESQGDSSR